MKFAPLLIPSLAAAIFASLSCERHSWEETKHLHEKVMHEEKKEKGEGDTYTVPVTGPSKQHENRGADPSPTVTIQTDKTQVKAEQVPNPVDSSAPAAPSPSPGAETPAPSFPKPAPPDGAIPAPAPATPAHPVPVPTTPLIQQP